MKESCRYKKMLSAFMDGELPVEAAEQMDRHLEICEECRHEQVLLNQMENAFSRMSEIEPSAEFERKVWREIAVLEEKRDRRHWIWSLFSGWRPYTAAAIAVVAIMTLTFVTGRQTAAPGFEDALMAENMGLLQEYDLISHLDLLENWEAIASLDGKT